MPKEVSTRRVWATRSLMVMVMLASIIASYLGVTILRHGSSLLSAEKVTKEDDAPPVNPFASANGTHLIAFVVTASDCSWSTQPSAMQAISSIREKLLAKHGGSYAKISVIGVLVDSNIEAGLKFVSKLSDGNPEQVFDQVSVGGSWLNEQIVRFVWREHAFRAASPQVLLIERSVNTESYLSNQTIAVDGSDRLLANPVGSEEIVGWIIQGLPLDFKGKQ